MRTHPSKINSRRARGRGATVALAILGLWSCGGAGAFARFAQFLERVKSWSPQSLRGRYFPDGLRRPLQESEKTQEPAGLMGMEVGSEAEVNIDDAQIAELDANSRLLQSLSYRLSSMDLRLGMEDFEAQLRKRNPTKDPVVSHLLRDTWRVLDTTTLGLQSGNAQVAWYSGGHFLHDGSILNGGLLKGALNVGKDTIAEVRFNMPSVTLSEEQMVASAVISYPQGHQANASYVAGLKPMPPTFLQLSVSELDMPDPMGHRTPLLQSNELIQVVYLDDQLLVWKDGFGNSEILVRESAMPSLLQGQREELEVLSAH